VRVLIYLLSKLISKIRLLIEIFKNKINFPNIFNWFYTPSGYYCVKSGFYIDHFFKNFFNKISKEIFFFWGLIFLDSFIVNRLITNLFSFLSNFLYKVNNIKKKINLSHVKLMIIICIIIIIVVMFVICF